MVSGFESLPIRLKAVSVVTSLADVPTLLVRKDDLPRPFILWMHGRTADKFLDPGRYLRYVRRGINVCAVDLPGHGDRFKSELQASESALDLVLQMADELDQIIDELSQLKEFDMNRAAIGGMSAGGIAAIMRLLRPHPFKTVILEATMGSWGSWRSQRNHPMFSTLSHERFDELNPINNLQNWKEIPILAFHSRHDELVPFTAQSTFIEAIRNQYEKPDLVEFVTFDHTGAPHEHLGFGRQSAFVKEVQVEFVARYLKVDQEITT